MIRAVVLVFLVGSLNGTIGRADAGGYEWKPVRKSAILSGVRVTGRVIPQDGALQVETAMVPGRIVSILRREGEAVEEGTPIYAISSAECFSLQEERRVATSKGLSDLVEGLLKREKQLGLRLEGERCVVVAGRKGVLTKRNLDSGASFNAGDSLATTLDTGRLTVELDVPERDVGGVRPGQKVTFQFASNPGKSYSSRIETAVPTIDTTTRTSKARLAPTYMPKNLGLDALVFGEIDTGHHEPVLSVPSAALVFYHNQQFVISGGAEKPTPVAVQVVNESDTVSAVRPVKEGSLHDGDSIATKGAIFLLRKLMGDSSS